MFIQTINKAKGKFLVKGMAKTKPMILQPIISYSSVFFYRHKLPFKTKKIKYHWGRLISLFF